MFNLKHDRLPVGSLIRMCDDFWPQGKRDPIEKGAIGFVIEHLKPARMEVLFGGSIEELYFGGMSNIAGYVSEIELISLPEGVRELEKW